MSALIAFFVVLIMYSQAYQFLWEAHIVNLMPGYWYAIVVLLGPIAWLFSARKARPGAEYSTSGHRHNQRSVLLWAGSFAAIASFSYLMSAHQAPQLRALKTVLILIGMLCVFLAVFRGPREVKAGRSAMAIVVIFSVLNNFIDFLGIHTYSNAVGRAAGFYVNPNIAGLHLVLGMILSVSLLPRRWRLPYCLFVGAGVALTFSRGSVLMWFVGVVGITQLKLFNWSRKTLAVLWLSIIVLGVMVQFRESIVDALNLDQYLSEGARQRLHLDVKTDESIQGRMAVATRSFELFERSWLAGHGLGAHNLPGTMVEPHNMFLLIAMEMGLLGLAVYLSFFAVLWRMGSGIAKVFTAALFVGSLFSHNLMEYSAAIWLSYALLAGITTANSSAADGTRTGAHRTAGDWAPRKYPRLPPQRPKGPVRQ